MVPSSGVRVMNVLGEIPLGVLSTARDVSELTQYH